MPSVPILVTNDDGVASPGVRILAKSLEKLGEVWVCAGQSNMAWQDYNRKDREAASDDFPALRDGILPRMQRLGLRA